MMECKWSGNHTKYRWADRNILPCVEDLALYSRDESVMVLITPNDAVTITQLLPAFSIMMRSASNSTQFITPATPHMGWKSDQSFPHQNPNNSVLAHCGLHCCSLLSTALTRLCSSQLCTLVFKYRESQPAVNQGSQSGESNYTSLSTLMNENFGS